MPDDISALDSYVSQPASERPIDEAAIAAFLGRQDGVGAALAAVRLDQPPRKAGASSGTLLCEIDLAGLVSGAPETRQLVFRYETGAGFFQRYELGAQFRTMKALFDLGFPSPEPLWFDGSGEITGLPGMFMTRVAGSAPSVSPFTEGPIVEVGDASVRHELMLNAARTIAHLHGFDASLPCFSHLVRGEVGEHWLHCEIDWALGELRNALPRSAWGAKAEFYAPAIEVIERVGAWLRRNVPISRTPEVAHGDAHVTNFMFNGPQVTALLDYELTHWGLGEADLAYQMAFNSSFSLFCETLEGLPTEQDLIDAYVAVRGKLDDWDYAKVMGEWRAAIFRLMGGSRLRPEFEERQRGVWNNSHSRLKALLPDLVD